MESELIEGGKIPWVMRPHYSGNPMANKKLFGGGPTSCEAVAVRMQECVVNPHFHLGAQFQVFVAGSVDFPTEHLDSIAVHYTDHKVAYGPFKTSKDYEVLVLHAKPNGLMYTKDKSARDQINHSGREIAACASSASWEAVPGQDGARQKWLIPESAGPSAKVVEGGVGTKFTCATAPVHGRFEYVVAGSVALEDRTLGPGTLRFVRGGEQPVPLTASDGGATVIMLTFDQAAEITLGGRLGGG